MTIRSATPADAPAIKNLIKMYPKQLLQTQLPKARDFFVATEREQIIGCCALEIYSKRIAEVRSLVVHPQFQKKGIANKLIAKCLAKAKKQKIYEVLSITGAVELFEKQGFKTFNQEKYALLKVL